MEAPWESISWPWLNKQEEEDNVHSPGAGQGESENDWNKDANKAVHPLEVFFIDAQTV